MEGGRETLAAIGAVVGGAIDGVKYVAKGATKIVLPKDVYNHIAQHYNDLPRGVQISLETALLSAMPVGTVVKVAGNTIGKIPLANVPKLLAVKPIPHIPIDPLPLVKSKYYNPLLAIEDGVGKISADTGAVLTKPISLEIKPITSSVVPKVEHKLPTFEVGEVKLGAPNVTSDLSLQKHIETVTGITKPVDLKLEQYTTYLKQYENWPQLSDLAKKVPGELGVAIHGKKGVGLRWEKGGDSIRIDRGDPSANYVTQQVDHVAISYNGKNYIFKDEITGGVYKMDRTTFDAGKRGAEHGFDLNMKIQVPGKHPDAHIPADQWAKWKNFHKPD